MPPTNTTNVLNELLQLHSRSLPTYLVGARPWQRSSDRDAAEALGQIASDHSRTVDRLAASIMAQRGIVRMGEFPMEFTDLHDLSITYLVDQVRQKQSVIIQRIQSCIPSLESDPMAKALAEEILGEAKGHLDNLRDLSSSNGSSP